MDSALDENPNWGAADGSPDDEPQQPRSSHESDVPRAMPHVKRIEMLSIHEEEDDEEETQITPCDFEQELQIVRDPFEPPRPRTQTDLSGAVPQLPFADQTSDELHRPIIDYPDFGYRLYPVNSRVLPGAEDEPTGLIQDARYCPADTYANDQPTWVPNYPDSHLTRLVDYDVLAQWLSQHLPAPDQLDALVIFIYRHATS